ncbi:hypothetical protein [Streptomyces sp. NPDC048442]|uniref:hypothetical protein n=1 Tax=Streptomyces sp. NPDC048442 TaxID=3154823 RepID=UPI00342030F8
MTSPQGRIKHMFRYAFLAAQSAVADAPKAAVTELFAELLTAACVAVPAATAAAAPLDGARS